METPRLLLVLEIVTFATCKLLGFAGAKLANFQNQQQVRVVHEYSPEENSVLHLKPEHHVCNDCALK
jgi:hypothetical protein